MKPDITIILNGFYHLPNLDKLTVVNAINEYFDSIDRDPIRAAADVRFCEIDRHSPGFICICCER
jgi:hypothetical protein